MTGTIAYQAGYLAAKKGKSLDEALGRYQKGTQRYKDYKAGFEARKEYEATNHA